jgi:glycosyltransferase involved in cell wall biosynthesis
MISTPFLPLPPTRYGGTELIVAELVAGLRARGHRVTVYGIPAADGPRSRAACPPVDDVRGAYTRPVWPPDPYHELHHVAWAVAAERAAAAPVDVIHTHCPSTLPLGRFLGAPLVYSIHHHRVDALASFYALQRGVRFVAISGRQLQLCPEIGEHAEVVHHGLDARRYPLGPGGPAAVFLGRLAREKGPHVAIDVARAAGVPLVIAGRPHAGDESYFDVEVKPRLDPPAVRRVGEVDHGRKVPLLGGACATLFPIDWEEPFGLVMIESMLCGTPVVAFGRGSVPEVIDNGVTGWVCRDADEMAWRLRRLDGSASFDRARCRARAVARFGRDRMVRDYLAVYERALRATHPVLEEAGEVLHGG